MERRNHKLTVLRDEGAPDGQGGRTEDWREQGSIWAHVVPGSSSERVEGRGHRVVRSYAIDCAWTDAVDSSCRLRYGAIELAVETVTDPDGNRVDLEIQAVERLR